MTKEDLLNLTIEKPDPAIYEAVEKKWDSILKPLDGLGDFEQAVSQIASIQGTLTPSISKRSAIIMCADNGIVEEGISQSAQEITKSVAKNLGKGISSASTLAKAVNASVVPVDIGIACPEKIEGVIDKKVAQGTKNFLKEAAMTEPQMLQAIQVGIDLVKDVDADIIATGEMGIGNTTTSTVLLCHLLDLNPEKVTGRGAGLDDKGLARKVEVVSQGLDLLKEKNPKKDPLLALQLIGGFDIGGLVGVFIGAALKKTPVVIDGIISAAAAVIASQVAGETKEYMLASHEGREGALAPALEYLKCRPFIKGDMALGEGTGAIMLFSLLDSAIYFYNNALRFEEGNVEAYRRYL